MTYQVALRKTDEGYSVSCPGLPGWLVTRGYQGRGAGEHRANPIDAYTMGGIIRSAGMTIDEFRRLL